MGRDLEIGITGSGIRHLPTDPELSIEDMFRMVAESGVYDYVDKTPPEAQVDEYLRCSEQFGLPVRAGGWYYTLGRDEAKLCENLEIGARLGSIVHNVQIATGHADGHVATNEEVAEAYLAATEHGESVGCLPAFEVHVNMWSEDFRRVLQVADLVEARGVPFRLTLDHSHVVFKIDNPTEQEVQDMRPAVESGELILDPFTPGNVCDAWIQRGIVAHCHARAAAPGGPPNPRADGSFGRGIQYPFIRPEPGQWHAEWDAAKLEPWKEVMRHLFDYHARETSSPLLQVSTEFIPFDDYGDGSTYSIFEHSVACATWLRAAWGERSGGTMG